MKKISIILVSLITVACIFLLTGCNLIKYNRNYYEYSYSSVQQKFLASGLNVKFDNSNGYSLKYLDQTFYGTFQINSSFNKINTVFNESDLAAYKEMFRQMYIAKGYSENDAKNLSDNLTVEDSYYIYKDYIFRSEDILGAKTFNSKGNIEGIYSIPSIFDTRVLFSNGNIYSEKVKYSEEYEIIPVGNYEIKGETIKISKTEDNEVASFILADINLVFNEENGNQNDISDALDDEDYSIEEGSASTKVLIQTFFSSIIFS